MTLSDRLVWIMDNRGFASERALGGAAKVSPSYIGLLVNGNRGKRLTKATAEKIANASGTRWQWVLSGEGPRLAADEPQPAESGGGDGREPILAAAEHMPQRYSKAAIAYVRAKKYKGADLWGDEEWWAELDRAESNMKKRGTMGPVEIDVPDLGALPPTKATRKPKGR